MKEQPCWSCNNFSRCKWSYGFPIENWVAEKSKYGYHIKECPEYEKEELNGFRPIRVSEMAEILGMSIRKVFNRLASSPQRFIKLMRERGYELKIYKEDNEQYHYYYIKEIGK